MDVSREPTAVRAMFDRIAPRYDLANHLLSGGIDFWWRRCAVEIVADWQPARVLDLATGSGDLALAIKRRLPKVEIVGADFSAEMLLRAREKGLTNTVIADALNLPLPNESFDCVTVAFGLRNMADWSAALREMARMLRADGHLLVLEFSIPTGVLKPAYRFYLHRCMPFLAALITRQKDAYDYLGASIENFPRGSAMLSLMEANGFRGARAIPLTGGVATIYKASVA